jgi:cell surface protein SprA
VTANRNVTRNFSEYYVPNAQGEYKSYTPQTTGTFQALSSLCPPSSAITKMYSKIFKILRRELADRYSMMNENSNGLSIRNRYPFGYSATSQDVLIAAFLSAYGDKMLKNSIYLPRS